MQEVLRKQPPHRRLGTSEGREARALLELVFQPVRLGEVRAAAALSAHPEQPHPAKVATVISLWSIDYEKISTA